MCLDGVTKHYESNKTTGYGWKIFVKQGNEFYSPVYKTSIIFNRWLTSNSEEILGSNSSNDYYSGFHIFKTRAEAHQHWIYTTGEPRECYRIIRVKYRGIICEGMDDDARTIVAREMLVPKPK
jgi:hypothetical protein